MKFQRTLFSEFTSRVGRIGQRGLSLAAVAAMLLGAEAVSAAPVLTDLQIAWLFDEADNNGYVHSNYVKPGSSHVRMTSVRTTYDPIAPGNYTPVTLVTDGTMVATGAPDFTTPGPNSTQKHPLPAGSTPFSYATNQAAMNDWYTGVVAQNYPNDRTQIVAVQSDMAGGNINLSGASGGAISMWIAPVQHDLVYDHDNNLGTPNINQTPDWGYMNILAAMGATPGRQVQVGLYQTYDETGYINDRFISAVTVRNNQSLTNAQKILVNGGSDAGLTGTIRDDGSNGFFNWSLPNPNDPLSAPAYNGFPTPEWSNIIVNYGGGTMEVYVNGVQVGSGTVNMSAIGNLTQLLFGEAPSGNFPLPMVVDELAIWGRKLDVSDIAWVQGNSLAALIDPDLLVAVPEPTSVGLMVMGLVGLARFRRKQQNKV